MKQRAYNLMKRWCDKLLTYEIRLPDPNVDSGLICPACHVIHGRFADLVYPLATLWAKTGDDRYISAAERYIDFTERNLRRSDGSYRNDLGNDWRGITAFSAMAIGDTLLEFGGRLPEALREKWTGIFERLSDFTLRYFDTFTPNINYYAGASAELALAYKLLGKPEYLDKANHWEKFCRGRFDENGLFYGEIHGIDFVSERGCRGIDMGYDLEESLPLLLRHAVLTEDGGKLAFYKARLLDHFEFLLPDGAIDNSFGTRQNKWTYWGSRTSDGLLEGLALVLDEPVFARAAERVLSLWEKCTSDDLLSMPMSEDAGEPTCLHHSFCHAKALAALVNSETMIADGSKALLPLESAKGIKAFQNGNLLTVSVGGWRATFSSIDIACYRGSDNSGGSMTLLWNERTGPVCASTMDSYIPSEPLNMQYLRRAESSPCMTPHLVINGRRTVTDKTAKLSQDGRRITASGDGWSSGDDGSSRDDWSSRHDWSVVYDFTPDSLGITVKAKKAKFVLPIICDKKTPAALAAFGERLTVGSLTVESDKPLRADVAKRVFNQVGGFEYIPLEADVDGELNISVRIS